MFACGRFAAMHVRTESRRTRKSHAYLLIVLAVSVSAVFALISQGSSKTLVPPVQEYKEVVVRDGDTLWHIARRHAGPGVDTRQLVDEIREANDLPGAVLRPGQVLKVPVR
ncbi:MAG: hypothetical protein DIU83_05050 [Bacillota bacterium]|nr:MAG: hypothetical protein DIU83_05050 [Bacillota bacterium]